MCLCYCVYIYTKLISHGKPLSFSMGIKGAAFYNGVVSKIEFLIQLVSQCPALQHAFVLSVTLADPSLADPTIHSDHILDRWHSLNSS